MHKSATKCNETLGKWCKNKHGASKIIDTLETYHATTNFVQQKGKSSGKNKGNFKPSFNKPVKTTTFKKKKPNRDRSDLTCFTCGKPGHFSKDCPERADRRGKKAKNVTVVTASNTDGMVIYLLFFRYFNLPLGGLIRVLTFMCVC
jgi:hypothetical protein